MNTTKEYKERLQTLKEIEHKKELRTRYINIDGLIISKLELTLTEMAILGIIYSGCRNNQYYKFETSYKFLSELTHTTRPTTIKAINHLIKLNYISKENRTLEGERTNRNIYVIEPNKSELFKTLNQKELEALNTFGVCKETLPFTSKDFLPLIKENKKEILDIIVKLIYEDKEALKELKKAIEEQEQYEEFERVIALAKCKWVE